MFLLFAGVHYYPGGGWNDYVGSYSTLAEAMRAAAIPDHDREWWHIVDTATGHIVEQDSK